MSEPPMPRLAQPATVGSLAVSPDGRFVVSGHSDGAVLLWSLPGGSPLGELGRHGKSVEGLAFLGDDLLASAGRDGTVRTWSVSGRRETACLRVREDTGTLWPVAMAACPDGARVAVAMQSGEVTCWYPETGETAVLPAVDEWICALAWAPDGRRIFAAQMCVMSGSMMGEPCPYSSDHPITVLDTETGERHGVWPGVGWVHALAFSPDGTCLAAAADPLGVFLLDPAGCQRREVLAASERDYRSVVFLPDGHRLAAGSHDDPHGPGNVVDVWNLGTRRIEKTLSGHEWGVMAVATAPSLVVSGSWDRTVRVWALT